MVNYLAILIAAIIAYAIGMLWYSPALFMKQWMKLNGFKKSDLKPTAMTMIVGFLQGLVLYYVLAVVIGFSGVTTYVDGIGIGALLWLGFIATGMLGGVLYEKMPIKLYWIHAIYYLVCLVINGALLAVWV